MTVFWKESAGKINIFKFPMAYHNSLPLSLVFFDYLSLVKSIWSYYKASFIKHVLPVYWTVSITSPLGQLIIIPEMFSILYKFNSEQQHICSRSWQTFACMSSRLCWRANSWRATICSKWKTVLCQTREKMNQDIYPAVLANSIPQWGTVVYYNNMNETRFGDLTRSWIFLSYLRAFVLLVNGELNPKIKFVLFERTLKITK